MDARLSHCIVVTNCVSRRGKLVHVADCPRLSFGLSYVVISRLQKEVNCGNNRASNTRLHTDPTGIRWPLSRPFTNALRISPYY